MSCSEFLLNFFGGAVRSYNDASVRYGLILSCHGTVWHSSGCFLWNLFGWTERRYLASLTAGFLLGIASFRLSRAIQLGMSLKLSILHEILLHRPIFLSRIIFTISLFCCDSCKNAQSTGQGRKIGKTGHHVLNLT